MNYAIALALSKYATFDGRTTRRDYWYFWLFTIIVFISATIIDVAFFRNHTYLESLSSVFLFIPSIAAGTRRMHDVGKRGWFIIIPFVNIYFWVQPSGPANQFGS